MSRVSSVDKAISLTGTALSAYNAMLIVREDPNALAREIAKCTPDVLSRIITHDKGRLFGSSLPVGGYFLGAGIDLLDPNVWSSVATLKLRLEMERLWNSSMINDEQYIDLRRNIGSNPAYVNKMLIVYKLLSGLEAQ